MKYACHCLAFIALSPPAPATEKEALVIGCSTYTHAWDLPQVKTDTVDVAQTLRAMGFHVTEVMDPDREALNSAILIFKNVAKHAPVALVYYSGHGIEYGPANYLIPVDAALDFPDEVRRQTIGIDSLLSEVEATEAPARIVMLDCYPARAFGDPKTWSAKQNPFNASHFSDLKIQENTMVVCAGSTGRKEMRGKIERKNSPFTAVFLEHIQRSGLAVSEVFDKVQQDVAFAATDGKESQVTIFGNTGKTFRELVLRPSANRPATGTGSPDTAAKERPFTNSLGLEFVPAGTKGVLFCRTETRVKDFRTFALENTAFSAVENQMEGATLEKRGADGWEWKKAGGSWEAPHFVQNEEHPVVCVSAGDAEVFAGWLTAKERASGRIRPGDEYRLPADAEWTAAAGSGKFPWGDQWPPPAGAGNYSGLESRTGPVDTPRWQVVPGYVDDFNRTAPVASFTANQFGLYDMGGNVFEWCATEYAKEMNSVTTRRKDWRLNIEKLRDGVTSRVLRSGSWSLHERECLLSSFRWADAPLHRITHNGFRLVLILESGG